MDSNVSQWLNLVFRWLHVIAGVMWIGHLWFFNFVNSQVAKTYDADSKQKVAPELMPRALYWFRWGAAFTWITGFTLLGVIYYMGGLMGPTPLPAGAMLSANAAAGVAVGLLIVGWVIYDLMWKALADKQPVGAAISVVLVAGVAFAMQNVLGFSGRAVFIHVGAIFGTAMAANVWMRIWPAQRRIIAAIKAGETPPAGDGPMAGLRSKHNTYMSMPLLLLMVSNHYPTVYGSDLGWLTATVFVVVGFVMTKMMYSKAASEAPKFY